MRRAPHFSEARRSCAASYDCQRGTGTGAALVHAELLSRVPGGGSRAAAASLPSGHAESVASAGPVFSPVKWGEESWGEE